MKYKLVDNPNAAEEDQLGHYGVMLLNLIKAKPDLYQEYLQENSLIECIQKAERMYLDDMEALMAQGLNQSEAREIAWPDITAMLGVYS
jgi:hypothetical protein